MVSASILQEVLDSNQRWAKLQRPQGLSSGEVTRKTPRRDTVDERNPANQLRLVVYPSHYLQDFVHPRWLLGISSINSIKSLRWFLFKGY